MTVQQATRQLQFQLFHIYEEREAGNITSMVMEKVTGWKRIDRILNKEVPLSLEKQDLLTAYSEQLLANKPVQYVLNEAWFSGMKFYVNEDVLIPRPETEELVNWIISDLRSKHSFEKKTAGAGIKLLDIGTGSGCIAIALKKKLPGAEVHACDVSNHALLIAERNSIANETPVNFIQCNILNEQERGSLPKVDIIVSNPPYIPLHNKPGMPLNVVDQEPSIALFVEDENPLLFYQVIAEFSKTHLTQNGAIYVEIHEDMGEPVTGLFERSVFRSVVLKQDLQLKDRMVRVMVIKTH